MELRGQGGMSVFEAKKIEQAIHDCEFRLKIIQVRIDRGYGNKETEQMKENVLLEIEALRALEKSMRIKDILGNDYDLDRLRELVQADREGRCFITPFVAMVEQSLMNGEMKPNKDQRFNGRYAVVYCKPQRWATPLIDICGTPYNRDEAEERAQQLTREAAEKALEEMESK